ncbi:MAG: MauE/DoxX family redox-associated membrane protein [Gammaproteobacteria bacterium]|jgi:hypothetical protein
MIDPIVGGLISVGFGLMFLLAAVHKLSATGQFRAVLADYRVMPASVVPFVAMLLPLNEIALGVAWLFSSIEVWLPTAGLLALYTAGITINLLRGRVHISCGCGFGRSASADDALSWGLVLRNVVLIGTALVMAMPAAPRTIGMIDYVTLIAGLIAIFFLFTAANQLIRNAAAINSWRRPVARHD